MAIKRIGSVTTPLKRALVEMVKFGALARRPGGWFSCNDTKFYDCTIITMLSKQLAIYSINEKLPGSQFIRLSEPGISLARAVIAEHEARSIVHAAAEKMFAEIAKLNGAMA